MKFLQRTPFFGLLLALVFGIVLFQYVTLPVYILAVNLSFAFLLFTISFLIRNSETQYRFRWLFGMGVVLCFSSMGYLSCYLFQQDNKFDSLNQPGIYELELTSSPVEKPRSYSFKVKLVNRIDSSAIVPAHGNAILYLQKDSLVSKLLLGDRILVEAEFKTPDGVQNPKGFDYQKYLTRQGIGSTAYITSDKWTLFGRNTAFSITRFANKCRNHLLDIYKKNGLSNDEFAVLAALTLGFTENLESDIYQIYSGTGAVHILSVSGLHVGIVYVAIVFLLRFMNKTRRQRIIQTIISILFIWIYALITGLSPAVLRASMMLSMVAFAKSLNRKSLIYNTVLASAFILLLIKPNLLFNIGFQLSYSAVLSIVVFQSTIKSLYFPKNKLLMWFWDLTSVSFAAQLGTAPISIFYFNQFPNYFLLTNYVAIPLSTLIIYLAIALLITAPIPFLAKSIGFVLHWCIWLMNELLRIILSLPYSLSTISISSLQLICLLAVIVFITAYYLKRKFNRIALGLGFLLLFVAMFAYRQYESISQTKLIVFSDSRVPVINFIQGKENYVFTNDKDRARRIAQPYWRSSLLHDADFIEHSDWFDNGYAYFSGKRIFILHDDILKNKISQIPLAIDYLIITNKLKIKIEDALACLKPQLVIIDNSISRWYSEQIVKGCKDAGIDYYSIAEQGAFIVDL